MSVFLQLTLWGVLLPDLEITEYMKTVGLLWPIHKGVVRAHFNMEASSDTLIFDQAGNDYHGELVGPSLVSVCRFCFLFYCVICLEVNERRCDLY